MDLTSIKNIAVANLKEWLNVKALWPRIKEALRLPYAKTYVAAAVVMTVIFGIFTFPYDMLIRRELKNLEKTKFRSVYVSEIDFSLIRTSALDSIYAVLRSGSAINIRSLDVNISFLRLLFARDIVGSFALTGFKYESDTSKIIFNMNGNVNLDYKTFNDLPRGREFDFFMENITMSFGQFSLPDTMGGLQLDLPPIRIDSIKCEAGIDGRKIVIKVFRIFGKQLNGSITGSIDMASILWSSRLDLKLVMNADTPLIDSYRDFLSKYINDRNQLIIPIKGSLVAPRIDFNAAGVPAPTPESEHPMDKILPVQ